MSDKLRGAVWRSHLRFLLAVAGALYAVAWMVVGPKDMFTMLPAAVLAIVSVVAMVMEANSSV